MSSARDVADGAATDLSRALLTEIAHLLGRSPESFGTPDETCEDGGTAELLAIWYELDPQAQGRLLSLARNLSDVGHGD